MMYTWTFYEFRESVHLRAMGGSISRGEVAKFKSVTEVATGVVFTHDDGHAVLVPWSNVRYVGGCVTPAVTPQVEPTIPVTSPVARKKK